MATLYSTDSILGNLDLLHATVSKLFVDFKETEEIPHAELRLVLAEDHIDRWNCSVGSNPGAAVNANSGSDITFSVQGCENPPANILISFEFKLHTSHMTLISLIDCLRGGGSSPWDNLTQFTRLWSKGTDAVVDTSGLFILGEPQLEFGKFMAKNYAKSGWGVLQSERDTLIRRGWFEFEFSRARGIEDTPHPYVSPDEDVNHKAMADGRLRYFSLVRDLNLGSASA
ncbi:unnamed protein product [Clonostachys chloroleuca]|uniref:Uncharacterized protein n=1 Tax=Clonostachys chloroleuca TaxID=1926264 RepID=A0AA35LRL5_9HYPO|nr:unnamed protein product [Clonostachys chloroleuca]